MAGRLAALLRAAHPREQRLRQHHLLPGCAASVPGPLTPLTHVRVFPFSTRSVGGRCEGHRRAIVPAQPTVQRGRRASPSPHVRSNLRYSAFSTAHSVLFVVHPSRLRVRQASSSVSCSPRCSQSKSRTRYLLCAWIRRTTPRISLQVLKGDLATIVKLSDEPVPSAPPGWGKPPAKVRRLPPFRFPPSLPLRLTFSLSHLRSPSPVPQDAMDGHDPAPRRVRARLLRVPAGPAAPARARRPARRAVIARSIAVRSRPSQLRGACRRYYRTGRYIEDDTSYMCTPTLTRAERLSLSGLELLTGLE